MEYTDVVIQLIREAWKNLGILSDAVARPRNIYGLTEEALNQHLLHLCAMSHQEVCDYGSPQYPVDYHLLFFWFK